MATSARRKQAGRTTAIVSISFYGAAGTVTGSRFLVETGSRRLLVDCGLFQGYKQLRRRNWLRFPASPASIDAVVLTHAHIDHSGYLPLLVRNGFKGQVHATAATLDLAQIMLIDSAHLMEADAEFANRHGFSKHQPALPLYTKDDAKRALKLFVSHPFGSWIDLGGGVRFRFRYAGHILGAAILEVDADGKRIVFSGDLGRYDDPLMVDPEAITKADVLIVESTYGDRLHSTEPAQQALAEIITKTARRGGSVVIPAFAVGRSQSLLYHLAALLDRHEVPPLPVFLDSPMAISVSDIYCRRAADHRLSPDQCSRTCGIATYTKEVEQSKRIDADPMPKVIISASGMATGGRILHHLKHYAPDHRSTIVFAGFQAGGTRGAAMLAGAQTIKIHGDYVPVRAEVVSLDMLSAHADRDELLRWLGGFTKAPEQTFVVHGEAEASDAFRLAIAERFGWNVRVPEHLETVEF